MVEQRDIPPYGEGLDASEELRPYQEPGSCRKTRDGEMLRGEINMAALHERIPLSRYGMRKGRHEEHSADEIEPS
jgi:hypothetical protein